MTVDDRVIWQMHKVSGLSGAEIAERLQVGKSTVQAKLAELRRLHGETQERVRERSISPRTRSQWVAYQARMLEQAEADLNEARSCASNTRDLLGCVDRRLALARFAADMTGISKDEQTGPVDRSDLLERFRAATASADRTPAPDGSDSDPLH